MLMQVLYFIKVRSVARIVQLEIILTVAKTDFTMCCHIDVSFTDEQYVIRRKMVCWPMLIPPFYGTRQKMLKEQPENRSKST